MYSISRGGNDAVIALIEKGANTKDLDTNGNNIFHYRLLFNTIRSNCTNLFPRSQIGKRIGWGRVRQVGWEWQF